MTTWEFPLRVGDQVRVTEPDVRGYYGLDGLVVEVNQGAPTRFGPKITCTVDFEDGRRNTIARYALTFVSARPVSIPQV